MEKAIGVKVKERIPDYVLGMADQLINVDLSAEDLRERLLAGKVYPAERINSALENFFTQVNLTRLREYALEEIAHRLDQRRNKSEKDKIETSAGRLMVCLSSRGPYIEHLLRKTSRLADRIMPLVRRFIQTPQKNDSGFPQRRSVKSATTWRRRAAGACR